MQVYRLSKIKYSDHLSGLGASLAGGRWNSRGVKMVYSATSRALAMLEVYVHLSHNMIPDDLVMVTIDIPDQSVIPTVEVSALPTGWNSIADNGAVRSIGDTMVRSMEWLGLYVPSAVVSGDHNLILNPLHPEMTKVTVSDISPFRLDERLFF